MALLSSRWGLLQSILLLLLLGASRAVNAQEPACPPEYMPAPEHPSELQRENLQGRVLVAARMDGCGRVIEASVAESSGVEALDAAAIKAVRAWVFPERHLRRAHDGRLKVPVQFDALRDVETQAFHWPESHRRARYLVDQTPIGYPTLQAVSAAVQTPENLMPSPYENRRAGVLRPEVPEPGGFYRSAAGAEPVYWLSFLRWNDLGETKVGELRRRSVAVARYRLVVEDEVPVVRVAVLCEDEGPQCAYIHRQALKRLPVR